MDTTWNTENFTERQPAGRHLSQLQIRALKSREIPAKLEVCTRATFARVSRELKEKPCSKCGELFRVEKYREALVWVCPACRGVGGQRSEITRFSESSRRNLMGKLNRVKKDISRVNFVTLTYPDEYYSNHLNPEDWKHTVRLFEWKFRRAFPDGSFVWRLEVVPRKSGDYIGELFPHWHLLVFNIPIGRLKPFIENVWHEIAGCNNPEHLRVLQNQKTCTPVISRRGVMRYASKSVGSVMSSELSKDIQAAGKHVGRWWGIANREVFNLFMDIPQEYEMSDKDAVQFMRLFRRLIHLNGRSPRSLVAFLDGETLAKNILKIISPSGKWCYTPTGRDYNEPFWRYAYRTGILVPKLGE